MRYKLVMVLEADRPEGVSDLACMAVERVAEVRSCVLEELEEQARIENMNAAAAARAQLEAALGRAQQ